MIVVSDTSPINYLIWIGEIDLLHRLYGSVILPEAVQQELIQPGAPVAVRTWAAQPPEWVAVKAARRALTLPDLGPGEVEAINLALTLKADSLLIDERAGRRCALEHGLDVSGTLGILEEAAKQDLIDLPSTIEKLKQTTYRISDRIIQEVLARDRAQRQNHGA